ncbi:unnamed protein product [Prorocentrum cordatum]|uniref:Uncharacterized protein n=1 Tax=Prorocentrum cordatum TaxID=2364126 RepID=A0ABN9VPS9_9DINO|nr:unnamed protein product [Polarella glacialis]
MSTFWGPARGHARWLYPPAGFSLCVLASVPLCERAGTLIGSARGVAALGPRPEPSPRAPSPESRLEPPALPLPPRPGPQAPPPTTATPSAPTTLAVPPPAPRPGPPLGAPAPACRHEPGRTPRPPRVVSPGGSGSSFFIDYLWHEGGLDMRFENKPGVKHGLGDGSVLNKTIYVYREPSAAVHSLYRRNLQRMCNCWSKRATLPGSIVQRLLLAAVY